MPNSLREACGVFSAYDSKDNPVFPYIYWGLRAQNHRGHQSHGFVTFNEVFNTHRSLGLVPKIEREKAQHWLTELPGNLGIGSIRYTTSGGTSDQSLRRGIQPVTAELRELAVDIFCTKIGQNQPTVHFPCRGQPANPPLIWPFPHLAWCTPSQPYGWTCDAAAR